MKNTNKHTQLNKNDIPLVSIIMPVYNAEDFLIEAVNSILNQTYSNIELICVNDGSTDNSLQILKNYEKIDSRVVLINFKKNKGLTYALNAALKRAKGKYVARMDSDDISDEKRIEEQVKFLNTHASIVAVGVQCELIDENNKVFGRKMFPTESSKLRKMMFEVMPMQHPTIMVRGDIYKKVAYEHYPTAEDVSLFFRLLQYGDFANIDKLLFKYRIRRQSNSLKNVKKTFIITFKTRVRAVRKWGYKPNIISVLINLAQVTVVSLLPSYFVLAIYESLRFSKPLKKQLKEGISASITSLIKSSTTSIK